MCVWEGGGGLLRSLNKAFCDPSSAYSTVVHPTLHCLLLSIWDAYSNHFHSGYMDKQTNTLANDEMPHNGSALFANP